MKFLYVAGSEHSFRHRFVARELNLFPSLWCWLPYILAYYLFFLLVSQRITNWDIAHKEGRIRYHPTVGEIEIRVGGVYFVYSQIFYADGTTHHMAHDTYINDKREMSCEASIIGQTKYLDTKYQGRIFRLRANDTISVRGRYTKKFKMVPWASFFGAFLVHLWEMTSF